MVADSCCWAPRRNPTPELSSPLTMMSGRDGQAEEELDRMSKTMGFMEKGKIRVKGLLEQESSAVPPMPPTAPVASVTQEPAPQEAEA